MDRTRCLYAFLLVWLGALIVVPAQSGAADFKLEIDNALLDLGNIQAVRAIDSTGATPDPPATLTGSITKGRVSIPRAGFVFPTKTTEVTNGLEATVDLAANRDITGQFDAATGQVTMSFDLKATVQALEQTCVIDPIKVTLSTQYGKPYLGVPFASGPQGPGALDGKWDDLPVPTGGTVCQIVGQLIAGPGGIWMSHSLPAAQTCADDPAHPGCDSSNPCANGPSSECCALSPRFAPCQEESGQPKLSLSVSPKVKRARAGGTAVLTVKVRNSGDAQANGVRVCAKAPRSKAQVGGCVNGSVAAGRTLTRRLRVKIKRGVRGKIRVNCTLTARGLPARKATATIKVR